MMPDPDSLPAGAGTCWFGTVRLQPLLTAFTKEVDGVKTSDDIEHIHRMRVASRRLRAALPLFAPCFPPRQYRIWMEELRKITQSLGEARDTDVQIDFLKSFIKRNRKGKGGPADEIAVPLTREMEVFLTALTRRRAKLQKRVVTALDAFQKSGVLEEMQSAFTALSSGTRQAPRRAAAAGVPAVAAERIGRRLDTLLGYEPYLSDPDAIAEHHQMRIAGKKLRYTIEVYSPVYRLGLDKFLVRVKKVQEILGDIHDCDVWIDTLTAMIVSERSRTRSGTGKDNASPHTLTGIRMFLHDREEQRHILHRKMILYWSSLGRAGIWDELRSALFDGRKAVFSLPQNLPEESVRPAVLLSAGDEPSMVSHALQVTRLSLDLFDQTRELHNLGSRERFLLECAGMLHDIGWKFGRRGHQVMSREMILRDEHLPFDLRDRSVIGVIVSAHRKRLKIKSDILYSLLMSATEKNVTRTLAALLRFADGMDPRHDGAVESIVCAIGQGEIRVELKATGDIPLERARALAKSDLIAEVFARKVVIL